MARHSFRSVPWEHSPGEPGSWHFVTVPAEVAADIALGAGPRSGFGSVRVEAGIGSTAWHTSLFPESVGTMALPVKKAVRLAEGLRAGDCCEVTVRVVRD